MEIKENKTKMENNNKNENLNLNSTTTTNRLRLNLSSLRTTSEARTSSNNTPTNETKIIHPTYRNRTPSLTEIQKHLIKSNMLQLNNQTNTTNTTGTTTGTTTSNKLPLNTSTNTIPELVPSVTIKEPTPTTPQQQQQPQTTVQQPQQPQQPQQSQEKPQEQEKKHEQQESKPQEQQKLNERLTDQQQQPPPTNQQQPTNPQQQTNQQQLPNQPPLPSQQQPQQPLQQPQQLKQQPQSQQISATKDLHPLQHSWTLYFDSRAPKRSSTTSGVPGGLQGYGAGIQTIGTFNSVEQFSKLFTWTVTPSQMEMNSSVQIFKSHIKPMWEDPANANGGKWTLTMKSNSDPSLLDRLWTYLVLGLVGEQIENNLTSTADTKNNNGDDHEDFICGAVVATRLKANRIQIWVKEKDNVEKINAFGKKLMEVLELDDHSTVIVEFSPHHIPSGSQSRAGGNNASSHYTPLRPTLPGGPIGVPGSGIRGMDEKMMGGVAGTLMRRSTSADVGPIGSGRINSTIGLHGNNFPAVGGGIYRGGLTGAAASFNPRTSQLSSLDPPIQNGVWRPSNPPASDSIIRAAGLPASLGHNQPDPMINQFNNNINMANRRHQSTQNLTTLGSFAGSTPQHLPNSNTLKSTAATKPSPLGPLPPGLQDSGHHRQLSAGSSNPASSQRPSDANSSRSPSRNPSPAPPTTNHLGIGILSGS